VLATDTSATLRRVAAWGLGEYADMPLAVEALGKALRHDSNAGVREMSAWALAQGDGRSDVDALNAALRDASADVRATAAWALGNVGDKAPIDGLVTFIRGVPSAAPRATLATVLAILPSPRPWKAPTP